MSYAGKKTKNQSLQMNDPNGAKVNFLIRYISQFLPFSICQRFVVMLYIAGVSPKRIGILTGMCYKIVLQIKRDMNTNPLWTLLLRKSGSGSVGDLVNVEEEIKKELDTHNYHSQQEIADMIWEKFRIRMIPQIGQYLKKWGYKIKCGSFPGNADPLKQRIPTNRHYNLELRAQSRVKLSFCLQKLSFCDGMRLSWQRLQPSTSFCFNWVYS